jgi:NADH-quinone oxidoreductase subunit F
LANVPPIIANGSDWYRQFGTERSPGTKIFSLSGRVNKPGNYELPLGAPMRYLIEECGGVVVVQEACSGIKPLANLTSEKGNPLRAIARKHFDIP